MDYFNDVLITFLGLERVSCIFDFIKNILICRPGLEQHDGE